jgi:hypothetical protein
MELSSTVGRLSVCHKISFTSVRTRGEGSKAKNQLVREWLQGERVNKNERVRVTAKRVTPQWRGDGQY